MTGNLIADRRLWLTADRSEIVEEGDPDAATLFAAVGTVIRAETVERFGIKALKNAKDKAKDKAKDPDNDKGGLTIVKETKRSRGRPRKEGQ